MEFSQEAIPGNIFEYFGTDNFILHVGKLGRASSAIISKYENGIIATDDVQSIYEGLTSILNNLGGKVESKYKYNYERENQIQALIKHIEVAL